MCAQGLVTQQRPHPRAPAEPSPGGTLSDQEPVRTHMASTRSQLETFLPAPPLPHPDARRQLSRAFQVPWDPRTFHPFLHSDAPGCSDQGQVRTEEASARDYLAALCSRSGRFEAWNRPRGCRGQTEGDTSSGGYRGDRGRHPGNPREATYKKNA